MLMKTFSFAVAVLSFAALCPANTQVPNANNEALVDCPEIRPEPLTPYGFAKAALVSLWYARQAAERGSEIETANKADNSFSYLTQMMRIAKSATNDFVCARRSIAPFADRMAGEDMSLAAEFMRVTYYAHIDINQRLIEVLKKMNQMDQVRLADELSSLQVEREQRWADLVQPTALTLMLLVDPEHSDKGKTNRVAISRAQKKILLDWAHQHFPELKNGTPKEQWSDPAKTAQLYFTFFNDHKCSDE
jgi:hypothetical protein